MLLPRPLLFGGVLVLASLGAYTLNRSLLDVGLLYAVGALGLAMRVFGFPLVPAVLGLVLGPMAEQQFRRAAAISEGDLTVFVTRPISAALLAAALVVLVAPFLVERWRRARHESTTTSLVIGGGNAGLSAALTARQLGARVLVLERAPRAMRGGNSRHARNLRCAHAAPTEILTDAYPEAELLEDLRRVNEGETDEALAALVATRSTDCVPWMAAFGARFQASLRGTLQLARTNAFFLGGGTALMNSYYAAAERLGIDVRYDAEVTKLSLRDGSVRVRDRALGRRHARSRARTPSSSRPAASRRISTGCAKRGATRRAIS